MDHSALSLREPASSFLLLRNGESGLCWLVRLSIPVQILVWVFLMRRWWKRPPIAFTRTARWPTVSFSDFLDRQTRDRIYSNPWNLAVHHLGTPYYSPCGKNGSEIYPDRHSPTG